MKTLGTQIVSRPGQAEVLALSKAELVITAGPDKGTTHKITRQRTVIGSNPGADLVLGDTAVSGLHCELLADDGGLVLQDLGSTNGTWIGGARITRATIVDGGTLALGESEIEVRSCETAAEVELSPRRSFGPLLGESPAMRELFSLLERAAATDVTLLIQGESGTGKDVAARAVHQSSGRRDAPFVVVDCGAIPAGLVESELFGHCKGAFTGASADRLGAFRQADGGTLFLDEVGELPLEQQAKLLRALDAREVRPVGDEKVHPIDVRVIAATHQPLAARIAEKTFREDLFYRLAVVECRMPPLRQRREDVVLLAYFFADRAGYDPETLFDQPTLELLRNHQFPGNVRELRNLVEKLSVVPEQALAALRDHDAAETATKQIGTLLNLPFHDARERWVELFEREYLNGRLEASGGVVAQAAREAELPRQSFHRMMRRHGIRGHDHKK